MGTLFPGDGSRHREADLVEEKILCFVNPADACRFVQMPGLETTILTGLHGEKMMMVLSATLPCHIAPTARRLHREA
jgi:hypothetical protein